jgi:hypothetical protein
MGTPNMIVGTSTESSTKNIAALTAAVLVSTAVVQATMLRGRLSAADADPQIYGPDVLGERLVIPPSIPDWIMMDCEKSKESHTVLSPIQDSICESN